MHSEALAQSFTAYFYIFLRDVTSDGGLSPEADGGAWALGKAKVNVKDGKVHAQAKGWVWNDAWREIEYNGLSGIFFYMDGVPPEVQAAMVCDYSVDEDGKAKWSAKVAGARAPR
jgi:hypothetical protein